VQNEAKNDAKFWAVFAAKFWVKIVKIFHAQIFAEKKLNSGTKNGVFLSNCKKMLMSF